MALPTYPHIVTMLGQIAAMFLLPFSALMTYYGKTFIFYKYLPPPEHHYYVTYLGEEVNTTADLILVLDEVKWSSCTFRPPSVLYSWCTRKASPISTLGEERTASLEINLNYSPVSFFIHGATAPSGPVSPHYREFTIKLRHTTLGRTCLDE